MTLDFAWWGNDDRAGRSRRLIEALRGAPERRGRSTFTDFPGFWEKRQTEAAGGGLPDVWQFSDSYLREYGETGHLLDLDTVGE